MKEESKIIYKKRPKEKYLSQTKSKESLSTIKELFNQYLSCESKEELKSFFSAQYYNRIYNFLFLIQNKNDLIELYSYINQIIIKLINNKLNQKEEKKNDIENIKKVINYINKIEKKIKNIKNILITSTSRFNSELIKSMNDNLDISSAFTKTKEALTNFVENSEKIIINNLAKKELVNQNLYISIFQFIGIIKLLLSNKKVEEFTEKIYEILMKDSKYENIYDEMSKKLKEKLNEGSKAQNDFINIYFNSIYDEIEKNYIIFLKILGEKEANKYKERIIKIYIFEKLINDIFKNEKFLKIIVSEKNYDILKIIESKTRQSLKLTKEFINCLFDILLNEFQAKLSPSEQKTDISAGIHYIEKLLLKVMELNSIFKEVFNENRKVQLKFHETLLKLISLNKLVALEYFLSVYINENLYKEEKRNKYIFNKALMQLISNVDKKEVQLISNVDKKEVFFKYHKKFIIKRISNNIFNLNIETEFHNYLKKNVENKYISEENRLFKDINDNKFINEDKSENYFYLFSFDTLDTQYDLLQIIDLEKKNCEILNPFKLQMDKYNQSFPKRKISISQLFSTFEIIFLKKYNLIVNYIQWYIIQIILKNKNEKYSITYERLISLIPYKPENKVFLKVYINSLIDLKILIKESSGILENELNSNDIIKINFNFESKKNNILCFIKPNNIIKGMIKNVNTKESVQKEDEYIKNYKVNAIKDNAGRIIDCIIVQILKGIPSGENLQEKNLIINLLKHKLIEDLQLRKYNVIDTLYIKQRIDNLVTREVIKRNEDKESNDISYSYY